MSEELKVGDRIKDNDPRMGHRVLTIESIDVRYVSAGTKYRQFRILRSRIFTDDKPRRTGFSRI